MKKIARLLAAGVVFVWPLNTVSNAGAEEAPKNDSVNIFSTQKALSNAALDNLRGGERLKFELISDMNLDGELNNNIVNDGISGNNMISDWAFAETNGFATIIQNTGHNVLIQNTTIVNVTATGP